MTRAVICAVMCVGCAAGGSAFDGDPTAGAGDAGTSSDSPLFKGGPVGDSSAPEHCAIATLGNPGSAGQGNIFATWLDGQEGAAPSLGDQTLTAASLAPFKVLVVQDVSAGHAYSSAEVAALSDWVKAGGGLMTLTGFGDPTEVINVNLLLAAYGMSYDNQPILFGGGHTIPVTHWLPHPVTQGVTLIGIDNGYAVLGSGTMLANEQGSNVLEVKDVGSGHVLVWGDEWITYNSEWSAHPDYQVQAFWQNIVDWFAPGAHCKVPDPPR